MGLKLNIGISLFLVVFCAYPTFSQNKRPSSEVQVKYKIKNLKYPLAAREKGIQGVVTVVFDIDSSCNIVNKRVEKGLGYGCDEEALNALVMDEKVGKSCKPTKEIKASIKFKLK